MTSRPAAIPLALLLAFAAALAHVPPAGAALPKPAYEAGDRWVYELRGSLDGFPGINASDVGGFSARLVGQVEVSILGPDQADVDGQRVPAVRVETRGSGFLNGTFAPPQDAFPGSVSVTGTFSTQGEELWEAQAFLPIASNTATTYVATASYLISIGFTARVEANASIAYASIPPFQLDVGGSTSAAYTMDLAVNTTVQVLGQTITSENRTTVSAVWQRQVLAEADVAVGAGTFHAFVLNQSLLGVPGLTGLVPGPWANETASFSNDVRMYVKRDAYVNGTRLAEMTLKSYTLGSRPSGLSLVDLALVAGIAAGALVLAIIWAIRRKSSPGTPLGSSARRRRRRWDE